VAEVSLATLRIELVWVGRNVTQQMKCLGHHP